MRIPRPRSLAGQLFAMQVVLVAAVVAGCAVFTYVTARGEAQDAARRQAVTAATTIANAPGVADAVRSPHPTNVLQPYAERVRLDSGVDFVTIMTPRGVRWTHPEPSRIGETFLGHTGPALRGRVFSETYTGTLGPSVRAVAPVREGGGTDGPGPVVALVSAGITVKAISEQERRQVLALAGVALAALVIGGLGTYVINARLRRHTHGMNANELSQLHDYHQATLHAVREGLVMLDGRRRIALINDGGRELLGLGGLAAGGGGSAGGATGVSVGGSAGASAGASVDGSAGASVGRSTSGAGPYGDAGVAARPHGAGATSPGGAPSWTPGPADAPFANPNPAAAPFAAPGPANAPASPSPPGGNPAPSSDPAGARAVLPSRTAPGSSRAATPARPDGAGGPGGPGGPGGTDGRDQRERSGRKDRKGRIGHLVRLRWVGRAGGAGGGTRAGGRGAGRGAPPVGRHVTDLGLPPPLTAALLDPEPRRDELHLTADRVLVVNSAPVSSGGQRGSVVTLRDHTELQALSGELDSVRGFAEALRSQAHEAANRLHAVVSLIELGRADEAIEFATAELQLAQALTDQVVGAVAEPVLAALLLGKAAQASEYAVDFELTTDSRIDDGLLPPSLPARDLVTILGNLVDNAIEAAGGQGTAHPERGTGRRAGSAPDGRRGRVTVTVRAGGGELTLRVGDNGPGVGPGAAEEIFQRGWSTKAVPGHGLGLAIVRQAVHRNHGTIDLDRSPEGGAEFTVRLPIRSEAARYEDGADGAADAAGAASYGADGAASYRAYGADGTGAGGTGAGGAP
ncbi:ATP-binding protein [Streptomyces sp. HSW2009]|uniref:sensor histidine kinase n=1 Tax=Streptomyces sp. HSW2009 TaxID=3142890 RepID=UPI0032F0445D